MEISDDANIRGKLNGVSGSLVPVSKKTVSEKRRQEIEKWTQNIPTTSRDLNRAYCALLDIQQKLKKSSVGRKKFGTQGWESLNGAIAAISERMDKTTDS